MRSTVVENVNVKYSLQALVDSGLFNRFFCHFHDLAIYFPLKGHWIGNFKNNLPGTKSVLKKFSLSFTYKKFTSAFVSILKLSRDPTDILLSKSSESINQNSILALKNTSLLRPVLLTCILTLLRCLIFPSAPFSNLYATWVFDRRTSYTVLQVYLPSYMIVVLSFMALWIPQEAVPARVGLGITTVLTIVYFLGKKRKNSIALLLH